MTGQKCSRHADDTICVFCTHTPAAIAARGAGLTLEAATARSGSAVVPRMVAAVRPPVNLQATAARLPRLLTIAGTQQASALLAPLTSVEMEQVLAASPYTSVERLGLKLEWQKTSLQALGSDLHQRQAYPHQATQPFNKLATDQPHNTPQHRPLATDWALLHRYGFTAGVTYSEAAVDTQLQAVTDTAERLRVKLALRSAGSMQAEARPADTWERERNVLRAYGLFPGQRYSGLEVDARLKEHGIVDTCARLAIKLSVAFHCGPLL